jgi:thiamine biosynthesis lipoprotein
MPGASVSLRNEALATSGIYFTVTQLGQHGDVSPLVDGRSGRPVIAPRSASVLAPSCTLADALTKVVTACQGVQHPCLATFGATAFLI